MRANDIASGRRAARAALVELQRQGGCTDPGPLVQENKQAVISELLRRFDPSYGSEEPIYTPDGEWSYARIERFLIRSGVTAWPRLESGKLDIDGDAFRMMSHIPGIEALHALRDTLGVIVRAKLPIGDDGRNRPSLFPFCTATGRNAHAKSLFNAHASVRSFMAFSPDAIGVYLDWRTQEVGIAAALSEDRALIEAYRDGDVYHSLALVCGLTDDTDGEALETGVLGRSAAHEGAAARDQLWDGRPFLGARPRPASYHRKQLHRTTSANVSAILGLA